MIKIFSILYTIFLFTSSLDAAIIADYHFDECSWNGSTNEIKEHINNYHATAKNGAFPDNGPINFSANLIGDNYIQLENNIPVPANYTISTWVKFPLSFYKHTSYSNYYYFTFADRPGNSYDFLYLRYHADEGWTWRVHDDDNGYGGNTFPNLSDGWHLLTFTANNGTTTLYIDSVEENSVNLHSKGEISLIGAADYNDDLDGQTTGASIDEFKVFDTSLSPSEIQSIYANEKSGKHYDGTTRISMQCSITTIPHAEYRFDSCSWDGTVGEVKESINAYNGTAHNVTPSHNALLHSSANMRANSTTDYISLNHNSLHNLNAFTISTWINTSAGNYQTIVSGANSAHDNEALLWLRDSGKIEFFIKGVRTGTLTIPDIQDNQWHHIIWSREDKHVILYIDGNKELDAYYSDDATLGTLSIDAGGLALGLDQDSVGGDFDQTFLGNIDEFKIFDKIITQEEVQILYKNDQLGYTVDGNVREIPPCSLIADYHFDNCEWDGTPREIIDHTNQHDASKTAEDINITTGKLFTAAAFPDENNISDIHAINTGITPMDIGNQGSISFWYQSNTNWDASGGKTLLDATKGDKYFFLSITAEGKLIFALENSNDADFKITTEDAFTFAAGEWVFITIEWDLGNDYHIYVNAEEKNFIAEINTIPSDSVFEGLDTIYIGDIILKYNEIGRENSADGSIDEFKIFSTLLTNSQIKMIYDNENSAKNYDATIRTPLECSLPSPIVNYDMDTCIIGSTVADKSGNDLNLTVVDSVTSIDGKINLSADFNGSNYLDGGDILNNIFGTSSDEFTITAWIKPKNLTSESTNHGTQNTFFAKASTAYNDNIEIGVNTDGSLHLYLDTKNQDKAINIGSGIVPDNWYFVSIRYFNDTIKVTINDTIEVDATTFDGGSFLDEASGSKLTLGSSRHSKNYFDGYIDEVKVFDKALTNRQVLDIYNNESAHKNYDGSHRMALDCTTPVLIAEYRFDACKYDGSPNEVIDSIGGDSSGTIQNFDTTKISTIKDNDRDTGRVLNIDKKSIYIDNLAINSEIYKKNSVIFWMYWDGTSNVMPFGWKTYDLWITSNYFGFNAKESLVYGIDNSGLSNGWHHIAAIFTNGDIASNRLYIDGVLQTIEQKQGTLNNTNAYANSSASISGWRNDSNYPFSGLLDELKIYKGELDQASIQADFQSTITRDIICSQAIFNAVNQAGGCFNWENNITTKVAGEDIFLTILSADKTDNNTSLKDSNITKLELLNFSDATCSTLNTIEEIWSGNVAVDNNGCYIMPAPFTYLKATKCAKIRIFGTFEGESVESNSSDTFAIRPDKFILTNLPTMPLTAEHNYTIQAHAVLTDGITAVEDYNTSITPTHQKYFRDGSDGTTMDGTFTPTANFLFSDGLSSNTLLNFNNVGIIGVELNDTTWAAIDSDDTPLIDRTIYLEENLTFIPSKFQINFPNTPTMSNYHDRAFTYYANDLALMGANLKNLSFTVSALGEHGGIMTNYQNPQTQYFANDTHFSLALSVDQNPTLSSDINESATKDLGFSGGIATLSYADIRFNFLRERNVTKNPRLLQGTQSDLNISVVDSLNNVVQGSKTEPFSGTSTFYYGKLKTTDLQTSSSPQAAKLEINVFWDGSGSRLLPTTFKQQTTSWYRNADDDAISTLAESNFTAMMTRKIENIATGSTLSINSPNPVDGEIDFQITKNDISTSQRIFYHIDIPTWLWYSRYEDYDFSLGSTCGQHPCFEYIFNTTQNSIGIYSGKKEGSSFNNDFNGTKRKAIKVLR
jgi:hypothetical protein